MQNTRWIPWLLVLLLAGAALAQPGRWKGTLQGTVKLKDGTPLGGVTVLITQGNDTARVISTAAGSFMASLDMGRVTASIEGIKDPRASGTVIINPGGTSNVTLVFAQAGVLLTAKTLEGEALQVEPRGACKTFRREVTDLRPTQFGGLGYFFTDLPTDTTDFAALVSVPLAGNRVATVAQQWRINGADQTFVRMSAPVIRLYLPVVDGAGQPLRLARVDAILTHPAQKVPASYWDTREPITEQATDNLPGMTTDDRGMLDLGYGLAGDYRLTLGMRGAFGREVRFAVADGRAVLQPYTLMPDYRPPAARVRDVQQLVLTHEGTPAGLADVYASYSYGGKATLLQSKTDARGYVIWRDLPAVRVIVWGDNVPAGVIAPDVTTVRDTLPEPTPERTRTYRVALTDMGDAPGKVTWLHRIVGQLATDERKSSFVPGRRGGESIGADQAYDVRPGLPFTVVALTEQMPPRLGVLSRVYAPYVDDNARTVEWTLAMREGAVIEGRLQGERGQAIAKVSRLRVLPVKIADGYTDPFVALGGERTKHQRVEQRGDGTFTANVYVPGSYRFIIDLFDESTPPTPELLADVAPGVSKATITLPAPLLRVPSGTMLYWLNTYSPTTMRQLQVMDSLNDVPIYGAKESALAAWYLQGPTRLTVLDARGGRPDMLSSRTMFLQPRDVAGRAYRGAIRLWPLFPVEPRDRPTDQPETDQLTLRGQNLYRVTMWPGKYLYDDPDLPELGFLGVIDVSQAGNTDVVFTVDPERPITPATKLRDVELVFPKADYTAMRKAGAAYLIITVDSTPGFMLRFSEMDITTAAPVPVRLPVDARTLSIAWLGAGVMRDVPIPRGVLRPRVAVDLPAWQGGQRFSGRILDDDGLPVADAPVSIGMSGLGNGEHARVVTDARGNFSVDGAVPGPLFIRCDLNRRTNRWPALLTTRGGLNVFRVGDASRQRTSLAVYAPLDLRAGLPGAITLTRRDDPNATPMVYPTVVWHPSTVLDTVVAVIDDVPPGNYRVQVTTPRGVQDATVAVTEWGASVHVD